MPPSPVVPVRRSLSQDSDSGSPPSPVCNHEDKPPSLWGMPLKYIALITLAVQNASLTIIMHHSRVSTPPSQAYSAASAVLLNELLKGFISLGIAVSRIDNPPPLPTRKPSCHLTGPVPHVSQSPFALFSPSAWLLRFRRVGREVFSDDCWKLSIPAILYVVQNNLQYVAAANLDVATFTVTYQMKILTTAAFSVMLLRKKLGAAKWLALFFLAVGVGVVQLQAGSASRAHGRPVHIPAAIMSVNATVRLAEDLAAASPVTHAMNPLKGFLAVTAACFTSGLAGVYFEMVLKGSKADLWIRNVQLSLFSLLPALVPIIFTSQPLDSSGWFWDLFRNFGVWAWATVAVQVFGGLVTAVVIKYSDNILKGFATSLSIIIAFLASVVLFNFQISPGFVVGTAIVLLATWMYNSVDSKPDIGKAGLAFTADSPILSGSPGKKRYTLPRAASRVFGRAVGINGSPPRSELPLVEVDAQPPYINTASQCRVYGQPVYSRSRPPTPPPSRPPTRPPSSQKLTLSTSDI